MRWLAQKHFLQRGGRHRNTSFNEVVGTETLPHLQVLHHVVSKLINVTGLFEMTPHSVLHWHIQIKHQCLAAEIYNWTGTWHST